MSRYYSSPNAGMHIITGEHGTISERRTTGLALTLTAPRQARRILDDALAEWGLGYLADSADIIMSELVTNAVEHGDEPALLAIYTDREADGGLLFIEVEDGGEHMPEQREATDDELGGRGLLLVDALAADWGTEPVGHGKRVWASLSIGAASVASHAEDPPTVVLQRIAA